jgi:uncharacterized protein
MGNLLNNLLKYRWLTMILLGIITALFFNQMKSNSRMETNLDKYMPQDHPAFIYSDSAEALFNIQDGIILAIENKNGIYNSATLDTLKQLTKKFQKFEQIAKSDVTSLYTADNIIGSDVGMDVKRFYRRTPQTPEALAELKSSVESNEMINGRLVSDNGTVTIIIAEIGDDVFTQEFYEEILTTAKAAESEDITIYVAGRPIVEGTMALLGPADMKRMVPIVLAVIFAVLLLTLRSFKGTVITLAVVFISTIWTFGLMATIGIPIYAVSTMIPVMLIAIGVADGIHLYSHLQVFIDHNPKATKLEAVKDMNNYLWKPVAMTSVTTAIGFISLLTSQVYPVKYFGLFTAFGVMAAMVLSMVFLPAGIMIFGLPKANPVDPDVDKDGHSHSKLANLFTLWIIKYRFATIAATAAIVIVSVVGMQKIWINSSFLDKFEKTSDIVLTDAFINENFGGTSSLNLILNAEKEGEFKNPAVLRLIDKMQQDVDSTLDIVGSSFSLSDYIKRMNKVMNSDDELFNTIPNSRDMVAQYILLYEMSGDPENLNKVVDYEYRRANVMFQLKSDNSKAMNSTLAIVENYKDEFQQLGITMKYAGSGYKGLIFTDLILDGQIKSLILSIIIIIVLLSIMFKNIKVGIIGSAPILVTALISFGVMGFLGIPLNVTTALLSSIAIGIGIDYAVHFLEQYRHNAELSSDKMVVAQKTMAHSGRAIIYNAIVVIAGFLVLLFSVFPPNRELGALVSLNMFSSLVGTLTVMLVMLFSANIFFDKKKKK